MRAIPPFPKQWLERETLPGLYADRLPPRNYAADATELARLARLFANAPANEIAPHLTVLAKASEDLDAAMGGLFDD